MGRSGRDWTQIYAIYGLEDWHVLIILITQAMVFSAASVMSLIHFDYVCHLFEYFLCSVLPVGGPRFVAGFTGSVTALSAVCLFVAAGNIFYSSLGLHWEMANRVVNVVNDWSTVKTALDVGCGRGILLNVVARRMKKSGSSGRVVGLDKGKKLTVSTLRRAKIEGVQEYVTCRDGDARHLPFADCYFDVVVSAVFLHKVGKEFGHRTAAAAAERMKGLGELVRVLKPGAVGIIWDLVHVPEYVQRLHELRMEDIKVSERVTAFMVSSHMVSFRKPVEEMLGPCEFRVDWKCSNLC